MAVHGPDVRKIDVSGTDLGTLVEKEKEKRLSRAAAGARPSQLNYSAAPGTLAIDANAKVEAIKERKSLNEVQLSPEEQLEVDMARIWTFKEHLLDDYGSLIVAWRRLFDENGDGFVSCREFMDAVSVLKYEDDIADLWHRLDEDGSKVLTLDEFDEPSGKLMMDFKNFLIELGGGGPGAVARAFQILDTKKQGHMSRDEMDTVLAEHGFEHGAEMHAGLDFDGRGYVTIDELIFLEDNYLNKRMMEKSQEALWAAQQRELRKKMREREKLESALAYYQFRQLLKGLFGSYVRAWRALDADGSWSLSMSEVFTTCKRLGFKGKVRPLWKALDVYNEGCAKIENIDRESAEVLAQFRRWCMSRGGLGKVYAEMDKDNTKKIKIEAFMKRCKKLGYKRPKETLEFLFKCLDLDGFGYLSPPNFTFLDDWRPPEWITAQCDPKAVEVLKKKLTSTFGNFIKAWRQCLDTDSSNKVTWAEFNRACERLKFDPKPRRAAAWRGLDDDNSGYITLAELDPESNEQLINFRTWADENFGSVRLAFKLLDRDKSGHLSYAEFRSAVAKYGLIGDTRMLFDAFDINSSGAITLDNMTFLESWDLDSDAKVVLPKKKKKKKIVHVHMAPSLALYRSRYEKDVAESITEDMAKSNRISRSSMLFGFDKELEELRRQEEIKAYEKARQKQLFLRSMTEAKPIEQNFLGFSPLIEDFVGLAEREPPPEFVTSCSSWKPGTTIRDGEFLPHGYSAPVRMPKGLFASDDFFSAGQTAKPGSAVDLPLIQTDERSPAVEPPERTSVTAADLPDLTDMLERRASRLEEKRRTVAERGRAFNERLEQQMKPVEGLERSKTSPGAISLNGDQ